MAHLTIKSNNENLSWVLVKNPASGVQTRAIRQGTGFGWFQGEDTYHLHFRDGVDTDSFGADFEYLGLSRFGHPLAYSSLVNAFLRDVWQGRNPEKDVVAANSIILHQVNTKALKLLSHLEGHLSCNVTWEHVEGRSDVFSLHLFGEQTLHELVSNMMIACLFLAGRDGAFLTKCDEQFVIKYAGILNKLDASFYMRYMFARNYFKSQEQFNKFAPMIAKEGIVLQHGDTAMQRLRFVEKHMDFQNEILDIGCGEGLFALNFPKRSVLPYHAVDIDEELIEVLGRKAKSRGFETLTTYTSVDEFASETPVDVLLVEVIEHMPLGDAEELIEYVMDHVNYNKFFITTPNKEFNKHYLIEEDEFRHDDHDWEMSKQEFQDWFEALFDCRRVNGEFNYEFVDIGDSVDGVYTSQGVIVTSHNRLKQAILTVGPSGSGKSTFAGRLAKSGWAEINRDNIRFNGYEKDWTKYNFTKQNEFKVTKKADKLIAQAIEDDKNIIISDTNLNPYYRKKYRELLEGEGYIVKEQAFDVDFETLLERNANRQGGIPYELLLEQYKRFQEYKGVTPYVGDEELPEAIIFDIDGTLADHPHRSPFDMDKVDTDEPIPHVVAMCQGMKDKYKIVFLSGRHDTAMEKTSQWLMDHVGEWTVGSSLLMREEGDNRKDYIIKKELFEEYVTPYYNVKAVVDDRKQVIEQCWNVLGVPVINVGNNLERF